MHGERVHPYALQTAAFYVAMLFPIALLGIMVFGRHIEAFKRSRKPAQV
ncbi:MAG TPA: hypothetical protein VFL13_02710 [Candidatus Baltobacteraceae bacterium]|nr:hypothetical protein [Candidatus Baltobacteraceae bacterium]